jgi:cytochrome bd-type quinol oxidase subunit 2
MAKPTAVDVTKVFALTVLLYGFLSWPEIARSLGLGRPDVSLLFDLVDAPGPHPMPVLNWWKVVAVAVAVIGYAIMAIAWPRGTYRPYPEMVASLVLFALTSVLVFALTWPDLSRCLVDRASTNESNRAVVRFLVNLPGGLSGQVFASLAVEIMAVVAMLRLIGRNREAGA